MIILLVILIGFCVIGGGKYFQFNEDYISSRITNSIKGILAILILFSHMKGYVTLSDCYYDRWFSEILISIGQLMVAPYLFYSGFGIMESLKTKQSYMKTYPKKRIIKTLVNFDLAVILYIISMSCIGIFYPAINYLTCWIGWDSVGNSNWFIFDILALYVMFYICYQACQHFIPNDYEERKHKFIMLSIFSLFSFVLWVILFFSKKGGWWIDTLLTFSLGTWFSYFRSYFEACMKRPILSYILLLSASFIFLLWKYRFGNDTIGIAACIFCIVLVMLCTKVVFNNRFLQWLGAHAFSIYIIQRLPMNIFQHYGLNENAYLFTLISIPSVLLLAWGYNKIIKVVDDNLITKC